MAQPLLETWSWTERIHASPKTIGARRECPRPESELPTMCLPSRPAGDTTSSNSSVRGHLGGGLFDCWLMLGRRSRWSSKWPLLVPPIQEPGRGLTETIQPVHVFGHWPTFGD